MIDIIAYSLITFFIFTTSLAVLEIKARIEHQPDTRIHDHEKMLADSFSFGDNKIHQTDNIQLESIEKETVEPEHLMIPEKVNRNTNNIPDNNKQYIDNKKDIHKIIEKIEDKQPTQPEPVTQKNEFDQVNDKLEDLIAQFEKEINKIKQPQTTSETQN